MKSQLIGSNQAYPHTEIAFSSWLSAKVDPDSSLLGHLEDTPWDIRVAHGILIGLLDVAVSRWLERFVLRCAQKLVNYPVLVRIIQNFFTFFSFLANVAIISIISTIVAIIVLSEVLSPAFPLTLPNQLITHLYYYLLFLMLLIDVVTFFYFVVYNNHLWLRLNLKLLLVFLLIIHVLDYNLRDIYFNLRWLVNIIFAILWLMDASTLLAQRLIRVSTFTLRLVALSRLTDFIASWFAFSFLTEVFNRRTLPHYALALLQTSIELSLQFSLLDVHWSFPGEADVVGWMALLRSIDNMVTIAFSWNIWKVHLLLLP